MDFEEEEKHSDTSSMKSGKSSVYRGRDTSDNETEFEFNIDDEEDIFLDARDEIIVSS